jgi:hypothetical protein
MIGDTFNNRAQFFHDMTAEEARLDEEKGLLEALVKRVAALDGDIARIILDDPAIRSQVIEPLDAEAERLGRRAIEADMTPADREAHVLARRILKQFVQSLVFRKTEREGYFKKLWKELTRHARGEA